MGSTIGRCSRTWGWATVDLSRLSDDDLRRIPEQAADELDQRRQRREEREEERKRRRLDQARQQAVREAPDSRLKALAKMWSGERGRDSEIIGKVCMNAPKFARLRWSDDDLLERASREYERRQRQRQEDRIQANRPAVRQSVSIGGVQVPRRLVVLVVVLVVLATAGGGDRDDRDDRRGRSRRRDRR